MDALKRNKDILQSENNIILFPIYETIRSPMFWKCRYSGEGCIGMYPSRRSIHVDGISCRQPKQLYVLVLRTTYTAVGEAVFMLVWVVFVI